MLATLRHRNFALLWAGGLISFFGDWVLLIALPVFVYELTGSTLATGAMFMAQSLPRLLLGSVAGVFVDRWDRRRTMIVANVLSAAALLLLLLVRTPADLWLLYLAAFVQTTVTLFFMPAESALLPQLVDDSQLLQANSLNALNWELTRLVAPPLGGLVMVWLGFASVIAIDAISFLLSAALIALIATPQLARPAERRVASTGAWASVWHDLTAGMRLVWRDRLLCSIFFITAAAMVAEGGLNVLGFPWLKQVLGGGALERGWMASAQAIGGLLGGLLIGRVAQLVRPAQLIGLSGMTLGLLMLAYINVNTLPIDQSLFMPAALLIKVLQGLPIIGMFVSVDTLLQQSVEDRYRGRVFGAYGAISGLAVLVGQGLASTLGDRAGIIPVLDLMGLMYLVAGILALLLLRGQGLAQRAGAAEPIGIAPDIA